MTLLLIVAVAVVLVAAIVIPLSRRIRDEPKLDPEHEARVLLGDRPADFTPKPGTPARPHRDFDPGEVSALRRLAPTDEPTASAPNEESATG